MLSKVGDIEREIVTEERGYLEPVICEPRETGDFSEQGPDALDTFFRKAVSFRISRGFYLLNWFENYDPRTTQT